MAPATAWAVLPSAPASVPLMASLVSRIGSMRIAGSSSAMASSSPAPCYSTSPSPQCCRRTSRPFTTMSTTLRRPALPLSLSTARSSTPAAAFSTTAARSSSSKKRRAMRQWYNGPGKMHKPVKASKPASDDDEGGAGRTRLFPSNPLFAQQPVLGENTRELVWKKVAVNGESVKGVSAELGIDMRRVAAVVRMKQIEKSYLAQGKPLAKAYSKAVLGMLPHTRYGEHGDITPLESVSEIHVHGYTKQQLFLPASETRAFTRKDAARAFHPSLLPPEKRMPIPELVDIEKDMQTGGRSYEDSFEAFRTKAEAAEQAQARRSAADTAAEAARTTRVDTGRFQFRIRDINAENVGRDGRSADAVGWRYGFPLEDRKSGQIKIPTSVE